MKRFISKLFLCLFVGSLISLASCGGENEGKEQQCNTSVDRIAHIIK